MTPQNGLWERPRMELVMEDSPKGTIINATGLPKDLIQNEFDRHARKLNFDPNNLDLEQIREILADYMQDVLLEAKRNFEEAG